MKAILEFNLPADKEDYEIVNKAFDLKLFHDEIIGWLNKTIKYSEQSEEYDRALEDVSAFIDEMRVRFD